MRLSFKELYSEFVQTYENELNPLNDEVLNRKENAKRYSLTICVILGLFILLMLIRFSLFRFEFIILTIWIEIFVYLFAFF